MYRDGHGVPQNYAEALKWFRKAANQGYDNAQLDLGFLYAHGDGVPQDYIEAAKWYRKAAEQGNAGGQGDLGFLYAHGDGVPQDYVQAYLWLNLAVPQFTDKKDRDIAVKGRDWVASKMTRSQIAEAQRLTRAFAPSTAPSTAFNQDRFSQT